MRLVIALGGNAMTAPDGSVGPEDQRTAILESMRSVADLVEAGHEIVLTHGNGPQVGNLLLKNEMAANVVPPVPLDWCVAQTQATIGRLILDTLDEELGRRGHHARSAVLVSRTLVDRDDPGFLVPTKPIGRYASGAEAAAMRAHGQRWVEVPGRGWRRVVASPEPRAVLEIPAVRTLLADGFVVVCAGGGGIPTVHTSGSYVGVEAVIDKDLTAALLAERIEADGLVIGTNVDAAVLGFGTPQAEPIGAISVSEIRRLAATGAFAAGSMGPKVEAVARFASHTGRTGVITSLPRIGEAVAGRTGTRVSPDPLTVQAPQPTG
ncbi:carbamate kinase [Mumia sp. zg.B53]|uniref:carbamate kinase n=1 Tax=unclassified Mumia TaxID=2621872 RepID=UPI001C6F575E|nr:MULTISPECIES: carbamate kinase [unclassified Mumia]MBW9206738.1 carbamate kinase [Mumia sp. zg.B17]MBW9215540.1 carbamate kinase [Mumia sp. zg.B53]